MRVGTKLSSVTCSTEVIVVRAPSRPVAVECGGARMVEGNRPEPPTGASAHLSGAGTLVGKRYALEEVGLELLCTRGGTGSLTADGTTIPVVATKHLPSSD